MGARHYNPDNRRFHLKPSVSRKMDVFKDSLVKTEKKVKSGTFSTTAGFDD